MKKKEIEQSIETQELRTKHKMIIKVGFISFWIGIQKCGIEEWFSGKIPVFAFADLGLFVKLEWIVQKRNRYPA